MTPSSWSVQPLGKISRLERGKFSARPRNDPRYFGGRIPFVQTGDVRSSDGLITRYSSTLNDQGVAVSKVFPKGTLLMTIAANIGDVGITSFKCAAPDSLVAVHPAQGVDRRWLYYALLSRKPDLELVATNNTQLNINLERLNPFQVLVPSETEQRMIAECLSSADGAIIGLERLLAKKRAIKQGLMQELLTGRTRLPGFTGEWAVLRVAASSHLKARIGWQGLTTGEYRASGEYRLVGGTDFRDGRVDWIVTPYVDKWRFDQDRNIQIQIGDVLITKDGTIGKVAFVDSLPGPATLNSGVFVVRPKADAYDSGFLYHMFRSRFFDEFVAGLSAGSTINHLYQRDLVTLEFVVPATLAEQRAVSTVIFDADIEIEALERRLEATRAIKQGMMQELLTGRTRLVGEGAA